MNKSKCPCCDSTHTKKNGKRNGKQVYKCLDCGYQFRRKQLPSEEEIWGLRVKYAPGKGALIN